MEQNIEGQEQNSMRDTWIAVFNEYLEVNDKKELYRTDIEDLLRINGCNPTDEDFDELFKKLDRNRDTIIDQEEFCICMEEMSKQGDAKTKLEEAFATFDKDSSGYIDHQELKEILKDLQDDEVDELIQACDTNGDGKIDIKEFVKLMHQ